MPYKNPEDKRAWDRRRNVNDPRRRASNSIGRYFRELRARIVRKREQIAALEKEIGIVSKE